MVQPSEPLLKRLENLFARSIREQTETSARVIDLLQRASAGELPADRLGRELLRFASQETEKYFGRLADLNLQFLHGLLDLNRDQSDRFFRWIEQLGGNEEAAGAPPPPGLLLELEGAPGEAVTGGFTVHNDQPHPVDVSLVATPFTCDQGGEPFDVPLLFDPVPPVPPGGQVPVSVRLELSPHHFVPERTYRSRIFVRGYGDAAVALRVRVLPPRQAAEPPPRAPRVRRQAAPARKRAATRPKQRQPASRR
jgi:hypothetical protein